jgi:hypothetical protein
MARLGTADVTRVGAFVLLLAAAGCRQDMHDQPKYKPLQSSRFFADGRASRPLLPGTVARGHLDDDEHLHSGKAGDAFVDSFPFSVTAGMLERGRERYDIFCSPCHDRVGSGGGMIVLRGYRRPTSLHDPRLREARVGYLFDVVSNGFGVMPSYAQQVPVRDRWAIVAYVRALQLSQHASSADVPALDLERLEREAAATRPAGGGGAAPTASEESDG